MKIILGIFAVLFAIVFLGAGVLALLGGAKQKKQCSASAPGTVIALHATAQQKGSRNFTTYHPEFQFQVGGTTYNLRSNFGSLKKEFKEGQAVTICYDPADPTKAFVADDINNSSQGGIMCVCLGLLLAIAAVSLFA